MGSITVREVGRMFGLELPSAVGKCKCPLQEHKRKDKTFRVFKSATGEDVWKCWSCDEPSNVGDAVGLFALLGGVSRKDAWLRLRELGYEVPGADRARGGGQGAKQAAPTRVMTPKVSLRGTKRGEVLPLPAESLERWRQIGDAGVVAWLRSRGFSESFDHRGCGVIAMPKGCVGFVYTDPATGVPCRVKVRSLRDKVFWNEPRPNPAFPGAKAMGPLYLTERLSFDADSVIITEGEMDALSLVSVGVPNVISLPDGSESANTVSLEPLFGFFTTWYIAMDGDEPGEKAWRVLRDRARVAGAEPVRVRWAKVDGEEMSHYKDANDALKDGFTRDDFLRCVNPASPVRAA